ncbi:MAG: hypothetical protein AAF226_08975 [Verrucomicrobiota bacterium]
MSEADLVAKLLPTLNHMKFRPEMWFREGNYLDGIYAFMLGYAIAAEDHIDKNTFELGPVFSRWLVDDKELIGQANQVWSDILRENYAGDIACFESFFSLLSEFKDWPEITGDLTG